MKCLLLFAAIVLCVIGCNPSFEKPSLSYSRAHGVLIQRADTNALNLIAVNSRYRDTISYHSLDQRDTLQGLECETTYSFYFRYEGQKDYSFLDSIYFEPTSCRRDLTFEPTARTTSGGSYLIQDILKGSIYTIGEHGKLIYELESASGLLRGFGIQDSLLVWYSDSSQLTLKNLLTLQRRAIDVDSTIRLHHDLVVHYPYVTALYKSKKYKQFKSYKVSEEGLIRIDLQTGDIKYWSIHDFLSDGIMALENATSSVISPHGNSVDIDQNNDFYISFRDLNQIWKIAADFSAVHYKIGLNATLSKSGGEYFAGQHSIDIISPDVFYLFDNGSIDRIKAKSRIVKVSVNPTALSYKVDNILTLPDSLSTGKMGSVHAMGDRLVISTYNKKFQILEIDQAGAIKNHLTSSKSNAIKVLPARGIQKY